MTDLPIPVEALEDCGAILGRRGAGKSGTGRTLFEHELAAGHRCCAIDPKGDWWGIRMAKDGSPSGFAIPIFGGTHGDLELSEDMGEMLGRLIATHDLSCVVDLSAFPSQAAQRRFTRDFAQALYEHNRQPLTLFVDEADQLAPQRVPADMAKLLHAMETLIRLGRQRGIFMWMLTQRPQTLNKNLLSQAETLIAMKVTTPHDRGAIRDWMEAHDPDQAKEVEKQLAKLGVGEAFVWVPAADFLDRVQFPLFQTYDSGRTPKHGEKIEAVRLPTIDLSGVENALALAAESAAEENEPEGAKAAKTGSGRHHERAVAERDSRIAELEKTVAALKERLARAEHVGFFIGIQRAKQALDDLDAIEPTSTGRFQLIEDGKSAVETFREDCQNRSDRTPSHANAVDEAARIDPLVAEAVSRPAAGRTAAATSESMDETAGETAPPPRRKVAAEGTADLSGPQEKILAGLAWWQSMGETMPSLPQLAFAARYSPRSTSFEKARGQLRSLDLVEYPKPGLTALTDAGSKVAPTNSLRLDHGAIRQQIAARLNGPQTAVFGALVSAWPRGLDLDELAANSGYSPKSTSFEKARGQLRSLGLADYPQPGSTRAEDWLFPNAEATK